MPSWRPTISASPTPADVDPSIRTVFGIAGAGAAPTDPASPEFAAYYGNYHGAYEPPFCRAQARAVLDTVKSGCRQ